MNRKKAGAVLVVLLTCGPVTVDVAQRNAGFHGTLTLSEKIEAPSGAPSPTDLAAVLSIEPAEVSQVFFGCRCSILFCATELERGRRSGDDQSGCLGGNARSRVFSPRLLLRGKSTGWRQALC